MRLLAIETSSAQGSIALGVGEDVVEISVPEPREQTARILPIVHELLSGADLKVTGLDAIVLGRGPGSFTGLRVAAAVTQGLAFASQVPIVSISSMAALAQRAWHDEKIRRTLICVDARMSEVYWCHYTVSIALAEAVLAETIGAPESVVAPEGDDWCAVGTGFGAYEVALGGHLERAHRALPDLIPRARDLLPLAQVEADAGRFVPVGEAIPVYLRESSAWRRSK